MSLAALMLARGQATKNSYLLPILVAQRINARVGGLAVLPWEVSDMPADWLDAFMALDEGVDQAKKRVAEVQQVVENVRRRWRHNE